MTIFLITWLVLFLMALGLLYKFYLPGFMALEPDRDDFMFACSLSTVVSAVATLILTLLLLCIPVVLVGILIIAGVLLGIRYAMNKLYDRKTKS